MKVLIMAAGVGSRISRHLHGQPKCCVDIGGEPLIARTFEILNKKGINDITIVTGYSHEYINKALQKFTYNTVFNPFFNITNSVASVWFARDFIENCQNLVVLNGDLFLEEKILDVLLEEKKSPILLADSSRIEDADYRFTWVNGKLIKYGKGLTNEETTGEYVGIGKISGSDITLFKNRVEEFINSGNYGCWWEDVLYTLIGEKDIYIKDIAGEFWAEVDYIEDYERILKYIKSNHVL